MSNKSAICNRLSASGNLFHNPGPVVKKEYPSNHIESYRIRFIGSLPDKNESYRIIFAL